MKGILLKLLYLYVELGDNDRLTALVVIGKIGGVTLGVVRV